MPTQSFKPLLSRDEAKVIAKPAIDIASPVLQETINYATNAFERCRTSKKGGLEEAFPVLASYLHIIQMTDSIEVLISNSCGAPADLLLRSSWEAKLAIEYILEKRNKQRAVAWLVKYLADFIESLEKFIPSHPKGKEFLKTYEQDGFSHIRDLPYVPETIESINNFQAILKRPEYANVYSEYQRLKKKMGGYPQWYSLNNGPRNLKQLAQDLNQGSTYEILYSSWSRVSHASDISHLSLPLEDGKSILGPVRNPLSIVHVSATALSFLLEATQLVLKEYRSGEFDSYRRWYATEIQEKHEALLRLERSGVDWYYRTFVQKK